MKYKLREYQAIASDVGVYNLKNYNKPFMLVLTIGAGKSLIIADICHKLNEPVLILCPNKEILEQNSEKLQSYGIDDVKLYSASVNSKEIGKYTYATIQSVYKKPELFKHFKYVILDECHQLSSKNFNGMYISFLNAINCTRICGLTATPFRIIQKVQNGTSNIGQKYKEYTATTEMMNRIHPFFFKKIAYKKEMKELIKDGFLVNTEYVLGFNANWSKLQVNSTGADFTEQSLQVYSNNTGLIKQIVSCIRQSEHENRSSITFASSLKQAMTIKKTMQKYGITIGYIDGKTPTKERTQLVSDFRAGIVKHLVNMGTLTTGFDAPILSSIIMARPTMSVSLYMQCIGRGVRKDPSNPDKILTVYDLVGLSQRFGKVEDIVLDKEEDGFRDKLVSSIGNISGVPLYTFKKNIDDNIV